MSSLPFDHVVSDKFKLPEPVSTSKSILRKALHEIPPQSQQTHSFAASNRISIVLASNSDVWCGDESYIRFDLRRTLANDDDAENDRRCALDEGGVNALIRHIEVRASASGILLQRIEHYNRWYALQSNLYQSPDEVDQYMFPYADSSGYGFSSWSGAGEIRIPLLGGEGEFTSNTNSLTTVITFADNVVDGYDMQIGDEIEMTNHVAAGAESSGRGRITALSGTTVTLDAAFGALTPATAQLVLIKKPLKLAARSLPVDIGGVGAADNLTRVCLKPLMSFWQHNIPLFLMKGGVEIILELEDPNVALFKYRNLKSEDTPMEYDIQNVRLMAMMTTPHPDIVDEYVAQWRSDRGLLFNLPSVRTIRANRNGSIDNDNIQIHPGVRSARRVYAVLHASTNMEGTGIATQYTRSLSEWVQSDITQFQGKVGAHDFPHRPVICDQNGNFEVFEQLKMVSGSRKFRFDPRLMDGNNCTVHAGTNLQVVDAKKFIMAMDLSRDNGPGSSLTGIDLSVVPFELEIQRSGTFVAAGYTNLNPLYFFFIEHDAFLQISAAQTVVRN